MDISSEVNDPILVALLESVRRVADQLDISFFIIGAVARHILMHYAYGLRPGRETADFDLGVRVASWREYRLLQTELVGTGEFRPMGDKQRLLFHEAAPVDLLPFGAITDDDTRVYWPPDHDTELNLLGFEEAYESALSVRIRATPPLDVRIASPSGLVLLKLMAWNDRRPDARDAVDLGLLIRNYMALGNQERLLDEHEDLLAVETFDYELAGARLLARDMARICDQHVLLRVLGIVDRELADEDNLQLVSYSASRSDAVERSLEYWEAIRDELRVAAAR